MNKKEGGGGRRRRRRKGFVEVLEILNVLCEYGIINLVLHFQFSQPKISYFIRRNTKQFIICTVVRRGTHQFSPRNARMS